MTKTKTAVDAAARRFVGAVALAASSLAAVAAPERLPALALDRGSVTVSGLSSGGYFAGQFEVAYSASVAGAAIIAGGPFGCAKGDLLTGATECSCPPADTPLARWMDLFPGWRCRVFPMALYADRADDALRITGDDIDDPAQLRRHRVWLLSGSKDKVVEPTLVDAAQEFYRRRGVPAAQLQRRRVEGAGHGLPEPQATLACGVTASPFLNRCGDLDAPGELLAWLYPARGAQPAPRKPAVRAAGLHEFDQSRYTAAERFDGLDATGWLYVPRGCEAAGAHCRLHVVFHGCAQAPSYVTTPGAPPFGRAFVDDAGYNRWAEGSRIVVLYPQVRPSDAARPGDAYRYNPQGCWDFWGYTDPMGTLHGVQRLHAKRDAPQMRTVKAMIDDLLRKP